MPFGALVLERLLAHAKPDAVEISVYGVREGLLYSKLPTPQAQQRCAALVLLGFRPPLCALART